MNQRLPSMTILAVLLLVSACSPGKTKAANAPTTGDGIPIDIDNGSISDNVGAANGS